jgi:hypothetical protein
VAVLPSVSATSDSVATSIDRWAFPCMFSTCNHLYTPVFPPFEDPDPLTGMAKLLNLSNAEAPALSSHQAAIDMKRAVAVAFESRFSASTLTVIPDPVGC